jgi:hypothetical protein
MKEDNEIIKLACGKCKKYIEGTYRELFGDISSLVVLPKMICKCGGDISLDMTGIYK